MFEPENDLERSLIRAVNEPAHRPDFLLRMFNAQTYLAMVVEGGPLPASPDGRVVIPPGATVTPKTLHEGHQEYLQFFTSLSRARARGKGQFLIAPMVTRELFERHFGKHFMLNPGYEHAQKFSSDDVNRMLAGQFGAPVAPPAVSLPPDFPTQPPAPKPDLVVPTVAVKPVVTQEPAAAKPAVVEKPVVFSPAPPAPVSPPVPVQPPAAKPLAPEPLEHKLFEPKLAEPKPSVPKAPESKPPVVAAQPPPSKPPLTINPPSAPKPPAPASSAANKVFSFDDRFVFNPALAETLVSTKAVTADKPSVPPPASADDKAPDKPSAVDKPAVPEKTAVLKTAAAGAFAAMRRLVAKTPSAKPSAPAETPAVAKPAVSESPAAEKPAVQEPPAAAQPIGPKPSGPKPSGPKPAPPVMAPAPPAVAPASPIPVKRVEASRPPVAAKPIEASPPRAAAIHVETAPPPAPPKPVAPPEPPPAPNKPKVASPPPGSQIGKPDPYPVDVLIALTSAVQGMPAIEAAHLAQAQLPGRPPHLLVALDTSERWEPLVQELGLKLQKLLPSGRAVELTPLTGGMFEDYFRNETQPFFKRR
jgi:hypothetical protein